MTPRTWVIVGATSIIAEEFAHLAAAAGHHLRLVGRDQEQLTIIRQDLKLRYQASCEIVIMDMNQPAEQLIRILTSGANEIDLFLAHSDFTNNDQLNSQSITQLIQVNTLATAILINHYLHSNQAQHNLIYLSSVAASRGRAKNSLYGASKAAIELYLEGLQQAAPVNQRITVARLGFIDTRQTYGLPGVFYAAQPKDCAKACWMAHSKNKRVFFYPGFWRAIMSLITSLPFFLYKRMGAV